MRGGMGAIVIRGDARSLPLPDASVDLIVTSPPYYALRSYTDGGEHYEGQIGSEPSPGEYIDNLVACTAEWMRVLKPSGSLFVDLGDKYATTLHTYNYRDPGTYTRATPQPDGEWSKSGWHGKPNTQPARQQPNAPPKSLMLLPERYRIACVDRLGLIARAVIIHDKPNGLPESVTDRVRRSHEDWVHLVKAPRYYSAVDEIREPHSGHTLRYYGPGTDAHPRPTQVEQKHDGKDGAPRIQNRLTTVGALGKLPGSVWSIPSEPLQVPAHLGIDHFAAFASEWPRRLILGWSPPGICLVCGEGRRPAIGKVLQIRQRHLTDRQDRNRDNQWGTSWRTLGGALEATITGYVCACTPYTDHPERRQPSTTTREWHLDGWTPPPTRPAVVLDPFGGTGTTALVASVLGRVGVSVDRSGDYCRLAGWRTTDPGQRAKAMRVAKPAPVAETQMVLEWEV